MNAYVLKLRTNVDAENGIAVVSKNDDTVVLREYRKKDEILRTYDAEIAYSWFIVPVSDDEIIYVNNRKWNRYRFVSNGVKDTIFLNATPQLFAEAEKKGVVLPESYMDAFKTSLNELFRFPVFFNSEKRSWSTASVFWRYKSILNQLDKTVNDFVEQSVIDNFFKQMVNVYAKSDIKALLDGERIIISSDVKALINKLNWEMSNIATCAFERAIKFANEHNWSNEWFSTISYEGKEFKIKLIQYHVYLLIPYGKSEISECVGWLD